MSIIGYQIGPSAFELIRDRIALILADELALQYEYASEDFLNIRKVFIERYINFNESELPAINVQVSRQGLDNQSQLQADGTTTFFIDIHTGAKSTDEIDGDSIANMECQRLAGICRAILEHSEYKTLAFAPPFIGNRTVSELKFANAEKKDSFSVAVGRITMTVRARETNGVYIPLNIAGWQTTIKLHESEQGYLWAGGEPIGQGLDITLDQNL